MTRRHEAPEINATRTMPLAGDLGPIVRLSNGGQGGFQWMPYRDCELVDVRLVNPEGPIDVQWVRIGTDIACAFARRPFLVRAGVCVEVMLRNTGREPAQAGVEIEYRVLPETRER